MEEETNQDQPVAADPKEEHATPGGNPTSDDSSVETETKVETSGGTTVTEQPSE